MAINVFGSHYTVSVLITNPGAVTNLNVQAHATRPLALIAAAIEPAQAALVTEAGAAVRIQRKTAAPTVTSIAASTFINHDGGSADAGFTAGHTASAEGTDGDFLSFGYNCKAGWYWTPTPEEYITVQAGTANGIGIKHTVAPSAGIYAVRMTLVEIG